MSWSDTAQRGGTRPGPRAAENPEPAGGGESGKGSSAQRPSCVRPKTAMLARDQWPCVRRIRVKPSQVKPSSVSQSDASLLVLMAQRLEAPGR